MRAWAPFGWESGRRDAVIDELRRIFVASVKETFSSDSVETVRDQVVTNLLSNALKFGQGGSVVVSVEGDESFGRVLVQDAGIGIALEYQERIFGRFERVVSGHHYGGLGLGLWIGRQIAEALGGTLKVQSQPGKGATFTLELPREPPARGG